MGSSLPEGQKNQFSASLSARNCAIGIWIPAEGHFFLQSLVGCTEWTAKGRNRKGCTEQSRNVTMYGIFICTGTTESVWLCSLQYSVPSFFIQDCRGCYSEAQSSSLAVNTLSPCPTHLLRHRLACLAAGRPVLTTLNPAKSLRALLLFQKI